MEDVYKRQAHTCRLFATPEAEHTGLWSALSRETARYALYTLEGERLPLALEDVFPLQLRHRPEHREQMCIRDSLQSARADTSARALCLSREGPEH